MAIVQYDLETDVILGDVTEICGWSNSTNGLVQIVTSGALSFGGSADVPRITIRDNQGNVISGYNNLAMAHYDTLPLDKVNFWTLVDWSSSKGFVAGQYYTVLITAYIQSIEDSSVRRRHMKVKVYVKPIT